MKMCITVLETKHAVKHNFNDLADLLFCSHTIPPPLQLGRWEPISANQLGRWLGPPASGFPSGALRALIRTAINTDTMLWLGPQDPVDIEKHNRHIFKPRTMELDADVFLQSDDAQYETFVGGLARGQGNYPRVREAASVKSCMTPLAFSRWKIYQER